MVMETRFDPTLVTFSVLVAVFASYVALTMAQSVTQSQGRARAIWLAGGAIAMGFGIWSMHFIGMLAFEMPGMAMAYDIPLMALSVVVAIGASALALFIISREFVPWTSILSGSVAMAAAIAGMHYIGKYSMRMSARIEWNLFFVVLSVVIALAASLGALLIAIRLRRKSERQLELLIAAILMGVAIVGMHYTGMIAAKFIHTPDDGIDSSNLLVTTGLTSTVIVMTLIILGIALAGSLGQRLWHRGMERADEILGRSEEKFRLLVEAVKDYAIYMLDPRGFITTWNSGAQRITGYRDLDVIGRHMSLFYTSEDIQNSTADEELKSALTTGHYESEGLRVRKDGTKFWASIVITPLHDRRGKLAGFSKVIRDITEVKEAEARMKQINAELERRVQARTEALAQRESQLRSVTDAAPILMGQIDCKERILFANQTFCNWFKVGYPILVGTQLADVLGDERYAATKPHIEKALKGEIPVFERESIRNGKKVVLSITLVPEYDDENRITGLIIVASDISRYKEIQDELETAKVAAEVANTTKSAFLANMSHEIRTPLGAVLGFSELLINDDMSPSERVNALEVIKRNGRLLSNIINDILDLSKVEAGRMEIEKVDVPFSEVMKEIGSVLNLEATEKGLELKVTSEGLIPTQIKTDPLRLRQILLNIVGNAIKFTKQGSITVKVKLLTEADGSTKLAFIVQDTGEGIHPEQVNRLFIPFSQADVSTTRKFGGTGLGLVLSKKLAKALGGDLVLTESTPGKGSTFTITIDPGTTEQVLFQSSDQKNMENILPLPTFKRDNSLNFLKVLIAEDSADNQALVRRILKSAGATVETANNGREAVEKALQGDFSLVLMDLQMPEMDGYEATRTLREKGYQKPIIALTAHAMKDEKQKSLRSGFNDHLTKPIDQEALIKTLAGYSV